ncbi:MAG TPA: ankyrin repeat domain-containing protein [Vicinamibacterales bacterium]|nr:ankyrin repeat domain-containing protein [Vicinamibacterales bacterium]
MAWSRAAVLAAFTLFSLPFPTLAQQATTRVDFGREVQPILRERCYGCHGPEQQMNGFRLDRRADALRGGTQTVIGPGNAEGTLLYRRLTDTRAGIRMPPTGSLAANEIAIIKAWIDQGVEWPDELAGVPVSPPVDPASERLATLIRDADRGAVDALLTGNPASVRGRASGGTTPLMAAALYGDADLLQRMLAMGADPRVTNVSGANALMWAIPDTAKMRLLLDAGVDVNARSDNRRTALVIAASIVSSAPAVQLLLEYGASPLPAKNQDPIPLQVAARIGNADVFRLLLDYGADRSGLNERLLRTYCMPCAEQVGIVGQPLLARTPPPDTGLRPTLATPPPRAAAVAAATMTAAAVRAAVERSLPLLQGIAGPFIAKTGCVSCHHNSAVSSAVLVARRHGYRVDEQAVSASRTRIATYLESWRERTLESAAIAGQQDTLNYLLVGLSADGHPSDRATDAQALFLIRRQAPDGRWPLQTLRPPIESNDVEVTAMSMRALQLYGPPARAAESARAIARARDWLLSAKGEVTEERAFRLLGLAWAEAGPDALKPAARELLALQRDDGGWSQEASLDSDSYATGEAITALLESGMAAASDPAVRRGVEFLLRTQLQDGSWYVKSRSVPIQAYFESGFPHGPDQWISAAGTAWAVRALANVN